MGWGASGKGGAQHEAWVLHMTGLAPLRDPPDAGRPDGRLCRCDSNPVPGRSPHRLPSPGWHDSPTQGRVCPALPCSHGEMPTPPGLSTDERHPQIAMFPAQTVLGKMPQTLLPSIITPLSESESPSDPQVQPLSLAHNQQ